MSAAAMFDCELIELVPDERIVLRWRFVDDRTTTARAQDAILTVSLRHASEDATRLVLVHERPRAGDVPGLAGRPGEIWIQALNRLAATLAEGTEEPPVDTG